ncbi:hypothetical protein CDD81_7660 [Ophiocordyceps australis]|uniref:Uncharacterized protein n=1 Tax=Ophiocordyceps australis TaxID=1399860 RepID=A0A2C5Y2Y8_9HYPO|nr:hypothetical protein CDD81_7660 [Ophiocordyceps australis]
MDNLQLTHNLADAFNALADQVQLLVDRKTVLEHKLRFAHEQFQYLADKYAPATPEIAETLAKLQLPPHTSVDQTSPVPLPQRSNPQTQHQIAVLIRDGRRTANQLVSMGGHSKTSDSSRESLSRTSRQQTSMSTALEQDFTVEGKKGNLQCPFSKKDALDDDGSNAQSPRNGLHHPKDPICAAMYDETSSHPPRSCAGASKCPIRFMDKHSPEEIAHYVETHKHELPRSHEVCLRRYQKDEGQMKKLDSKYGNIVSMIEGLSQIHQSMLPDEQAGPSRPQSDDDGPSIQRVETWAQAVSKAATSEANRGASPEELDRQGHFDRPLKEVRVGESPSRPWGISVPCYEASGHANSAPSSPPPAPVRMSSPRLGHGTPQRMVGKGKCPFDHTRLAASQEPRPAPNVQGEPSAAPTCHRDAPFTVAQEPLGPSSTSKPQPAFINPGAQGDKAGSVASMVFTGPVFIGYPVEQAIELMKHYRGNS